jgi:hypothetical protein
MKRPDRALNKHPVTAPPKKAFRIRKLLRDRGSLRQALLLKEILVRPYE